MKKLLKPLGTIFIIGAFLFLFIHSFIVTSTHGEDFARDLFGFPIPHPPVWTSYIPILGIALRYLFEFFSLHGLVGLVVFTILVCIGLQLQRIGKGKYE